MLHLLRTLTDVLFPVRSSAALVAAATPTTLQMLYEPRTVDTTEVLLPYCDPLVRALITEAKFHHSKRAQQLLAGVLEYHLAQSESADLVLPIPLSRVRERERGFNQVTAVARQVSKLPLSSTALKRTRDTQPQTTLRRAERLVNIRDAFTVVAPAEIAGKTILIIDDVSTTGATLQAARAAVQQASPARIRLLAFAH